MQSKFYLAISRRRWAFSEMKRYFWSKNKRISSHPTGPFPFHNEAFTLSFLHLSRPWENYPLLGLVSLESSLCFALPSLPSIFPIFGPFLSSWFIILATEPSSLLVTFYCPDNAGLLSVTAYPPGVYYTTRDHPTSRPVLWRKWQFSHGIKPNEDHLRTCSLWEFIREGINVQRQDKWRVTDRESVIKALVTLSSMNSSSPLSTFPFSTFPNSVLLK